MSRGDPADRADDDTAGDRAEDDEQWEFTLEDVSPDPGSEGTYEMGPIEAGDPKPEHVLFFVLGVLAAVGALYAFLL